MSTLHALPPAHDIRSVVAGEIRAWMGRRGLRQSDLADELGITQSQFSKRLRGTIPIDIVELDKIARYLGVDTAELLGGTTRNPHPDGPDGGEGVRHQGLEPRTR